MDATTKKFDVWVGLTYEVTEIAAAADAVQRAMVDFTSSRAVMVGASRSRHLINLKLAADRLAESAKVIRVHSGQVENLCTHMARMAAKHAARNGNGRE